MGDSSVTVYAAGSAGNVAPIATISGTNTGLSNPFGIALDSSNNIYVANGINTGTASVTVYAAGSNGNVAPTKSISGSATDLNSPVGIAVGPNNRICVANVGGTSVTLHKAYSSLALGNNNIPPIKYVVGPNTQFDAPYGITGPLKHIGGHLVRAA